MNTSLGLPLNGRDKQLSKFNNFPLEVDHSMSFKDIVTFISFPSFQEFLGLNECLETVIELKLV